ncbi:hypothetical protein [Bacillus velezensis]|uniref:hypothetical protein n=1 Tax=Bacillus velezensis TaxID=492670 RepID=UPI0018E85099|nr:hypothetical protein [Bacillus velezensis]
MKADSGLPREEFLMAFNKNNVNYFTTIPEVSRPHILIEYSQNKDLSQSQLMPFKEGNKIISDLIKDPAALALIKLDIISFILKVSTEIKKCR